nr:hypothetical protein [Gammaproteobacteria bacterium]
MIKFIRDIIHILDPELKKRLYYIIPLTMLLGIVQMIGVAMLFPFMSAVMKPSTIQASVKFQYIYHKLHFGSPQKFLIFMGCVALFFLIFGNLFNIAM